MKTYIIHARKKDSKVIEPIEITQSVVPLLQVITACDDNVVDLKHHQEDIIDYLSGDPTGGSQIVRILKKYNEVKLKRF